ncbi:MAG TPA: TRAP transporter substrate-binding protein [Thermoleophilia bacterium]|nr:TRAP transporter substrate-binding protein [Thermoleophilia bacterium]
MFVLVGVALLLSFTVLVGCGGTSTTTTTAAAGDTTTTAAEDTTTTAETLDDTVYELSIAHIWPATHAIQTRLIDPMAKEISDATDGKVKLVSYPGGTLLKGPEVYEGVVTGVADMGISVYGYNAGRFPVVEAFLLPGISWATAKSAGEAVTEGLQMYGEQEISDTHVFMSFATGPGEMLMKVPVRTLADMKGLEIGATAGPRGDGLKLLGATPVVLPMPEVYEAQSRGVIKGVVGPYEAMTGFKLADVTDYITDTPFLYVNYFFLNMNKDKFDALPAPYQEALTTIMDKYYNDVALGLFDDLNKEALDAAMSTKKIEMITLPDAEQTLWKEKLAPIFTDYQAVLDGKGLDGAKIIETVKQLSDKYNAMYPAQ